MIQKYKQEKYKGKIILKMDRNKCDKNWKVPLKPV